jgi:hypothetical protein
MRVFQKALTTTSLLLFFFVGCKSHAPREEQAGYEHPGIQWLSWNSTERRNFVSGYIEGFEVGMNQACLAADDLFERDKPRSFGYDNVPSTFPSARCRASVDQYSNLKVSVSTGPDYSPYISVITTFYSKYPNARNVPYVDLIRFLTDAKHKTADELYSMAKKGEFSVPVR